MWNKKDFLKENWPKKTKESSNYMHLILTPVIQKHKYSLFNRQFY